MLTRTSESSRARSHLEKDRLKRQSRDITSRLTPLKIYLLSYNIFSALLWLHLLFLTLSSILTPPSNTTASILSRLLSPASSRSSSLTDRLRNSYDHKHLGWYTKYTQCLAVLEVVHSALGWVRSPVVTSVMQTLSRLWTVWAVVEAKQETHGNPLFGSMLFAWSVTEVIRYSFYALSVLGIEVSWLNYLRYTTFIPLYPLGAISEAFLSFSTLPPLFTLPYLPQSLTSVSPFSTLFTRFGPSIAKTLMRSEFGRGMLWKMAQAGLKAKTVMRGTWGWMQIARLVMFLIWWPSLYVLYTHMFRQRRRVMGAGQRVRAKSKTT